MQAASKRLLSVRKRFRLVKQTGRGQRMHKVKRTWVENRGQGAISACKKSKPNRH
jgi:hypothetical protein